MTQAREWPNAAKEARDQTAEHAQAASKALRPLIEQPQSDPAFVISSVAKAMYHTQLVLRLMEGVGAQTRPT